MFQSSTSIISIENYFAEDYFTENRPDEIPSKLRSFLDENQVIIQIITIYAGGIGIVLEGSYSRKFSILRFHRPPAISGRGHIVTNRLNFEWRKKELMHLIIWQVSVWH